MLQDVEQFADVAGLEACVDMLKKGALVARDPTDIEIIPELDENDRIALRDELSRKWNQPKAMWLTVAVCSIGAAVQGWDQVSI